ncbi:hypothetical protein EVAR_94354_1 [Eumeta japonica]|uniref:Uncharacterized protein n=1 Tax=Eumeta variegata TaxID=151549 RepID=A0A4C1TPW4_EUMVA|nr:hypothetical protein EVAR_94354_1 [Eumeta japonica]
MGLTCIERGCVQYEERFAKFHLNRDSSFVKFANRHCRFDTIFGILSGVNPKASRWLEPRFRARFRARREMSKSHVESQVSLLTFLIAHSSVNVERRRPEVNEKSRQNIIEQETRLRVNTSHACRDRRRAAIAVPTDPEFVLER